MKPKKNQLFTVILIIFMILFSIHFSYALSCMPTINFISEIKELNDSQYGVHIILESDIYTFNQEEMYDYNSSIINMDSYTDLIKNFRVNDNKLDKYEIKKLSYLEKKNYFYPENSKYVSMNFSKYNILLEDGDLYVTGTPFHICDYGFSAIFSNKGDLKYMFVNTDYDGFMLNNFTVEILESKPLNFLCVSNVCKTGVDLEFNLQIQTLFHNQTINLSQIGGILTLIDASNYNENFEDNYFDWGFGKYANYYVDFTKSNNITIYNNQTIINEEDEVTKENSFVYNVLSFFRNLF